MTINRIKWIKTNHKGLRYYEHRERKHGKKRDRYYAIRFKVDGKEHGYGIGWLSDGIPDEVRGKDPGLGFEDYCLMLLRQFKQNVKTGSGPKSPKEKRAIENEKQQQAEAEKKRTEKENITFAHFMTEVYFPQCKQDKKSNTCKTEEGLYRNHLAETIGRLPLKSITPFNLERIKKDMFEKGLFEVCHNLNCFLAGGDLRHERFFSYLGHVSRAPNLFHYYGLQANIDNIYRHVLSLVNLAYLFELAEGFKKPRYDLNNVALDQKSGFKVAKNLKKEIEAYFTNWRKTFDKIEDNESADRLFNEILKAPLQIVYSGSKPKSQKEKRAIDIKAIRLLLSQICWIPYFLMGSGIMRLTEIYLGRLDQFAQRIAMDTAKAKEIWFDKLKESLDNAKSPDGSRKPYSELRNVMREMEQQKLHITRVVRGEKRFCADKIFKLLKKASEKDPKIYGEYKVWTEEYETAEGTVKEIKIKEIGEEVSVRHSKSNLENRLFTKKIFPETA